VASADVLTARLRAAGSVFAEEEAALLIAEASSPDALERMTTQREAGVPLEVIVGWAEFCGLRVIVEPGVFVPRHRTEFLVAEAAGLAVPGAVALDLCCGTGALGLALARLVDVDLYAADIDPAAVHCARRNLPAERVFEGDLFEALPAGLRFDLVLANTPYVPTASIALMPPEAREYEATVALDGGGDGLDIQRRVAAAASARLNPGGHVLVEASAEQAPVSASIFAAAGLDSLIVYSEEFEATVVVGTLKK
jgi:release factor glutamine methyltransferase